MSSTNSKSAPRAQRLDLDLAVAELAVAAGLLLVAAVRLGRRLDRLAVRDARRLEVHVDAEPPLQLRDGHLDVQLSLAGEQQLLGLRVAAVADRRVFFLEPVHRRADLVFVAAALRLDRVRQHRLGELDRREGDRVGLVAERVVGQRVLQLRHGAEVAGLDLRHVRRRLALHQHQVAEPLRRVLASCCGPSSRPSACRRRRGTCVMRPANGSAIVFHTNADSGPFSSAARATAAPSLSRPANGRSAGDGRYATMASSSCGTPTFSSADVQTSGKILPRDRRAAQPGHELVVGQRAGLEEVLHQLLVGLGDHLDQRFARGVDRGRSCRRARRLR